MLNIFGYIHFAGPVPPHVKSKMSSLFETKNTNYRDMRFDANDVFILFKTLALKESSRYIYQNKNKKMACFVTGDIFAEGSMAPRQLSGLNLAQWAAEKYSSHSWSQFCKLRGIFNIILVKDKTVFLANDSLGLSPMYIYPTGNGCFFCNEAEPILWAGKDHCVDAARVAEFLVYGFIPNGKTFVRGLEAQKEASITTICAAGVRTRSYGDFQAIKWGRMPYQERLKILNDTCREAIGIRAGQKTVFSDLTGGWDTRFILAHLLDLGHKPIVFTMGGNGGSDPTYDVVIARYIAKKFGLRHITQNATLRKESDHENATLMFHPWFSPFHQREFKRIKYNNSEKQLSRADFFTSPVFSGLYGTELFGYVPETFQRRIPLDVFSVGRNIFKSRLFAQRNFKKQLAETQEIFLTLRRKNPNNAFSFLTQIGRSYLHSLFSVGMERPRNHFNYLRLLPFVDSRFVACLSSLDQKQYFNYKAYGDIYKKFFPGFLKIPWTFFGPYRSKSLPKKREKKIYFSKNFLRAHLAKNRAFNHFIANNPWIEPSPFLIKERLKETYFLFRWLETNKPYLKINSYLS